MSARDVTRADAFASRAWADGQMDQFEKALRLRWQIEEREREERLRRQAALQDVPVGIWVFAGVVTVGVLIWISINLPLVGAVLAVVTGAVILWTLYRPCEDDETDDEVELLAPRDTRRRVAHLDPLTTPLPADARAVADALDQGRARLYLEAVQRGFLPAPTRARADGYERVCVPLPGGRITPTDVALDRYAATLGITSGRVRRGPDVPGVLVLDVLDVAPADLPVSAWPALGSRTDWTEPMPLGVDEVGEPVTLPLAGRRVLVAGMSGSGKTRLIRTIALWAAGDPGVQLHVLDLKRSPALACLRERAAWWHAGPATSAVVAHLRGLVAEMHARYEAGIPDDLPWIVLVIDEAQALWRERGAADVVEELARMGREARIGIVIGSQTPDRASIPTTIAGEADVRIALRLSSTWAPGLVLGEWDRDCATLPPPGHAWIVLPDGTVRRVAAHDVDDDAAARHLHALPALPPPPPRPRDDLADVLDALGDRPGAPWDDLADALDLDPDDLRATLRARGIKSATVRLPGATHTVRGVRRADVEAALAA